MSNYLVLNGLQELMASLKAGIFSHANRSLHRKSLVEDRLVPELIKLCGLVELLRDIFQNQPTVPGSSQPNTQIQETISDLCQRISVLDDPEIIWEIQSYSGNLHAELKALQERGALLESIFRNVAKNRDIIESGQNDESFARTRISTELDELSRSVIRITEECSIIKEHRERLRFKIISDYSEPPLLDLVETFLGNGNEAWQTLYNGGCYEAKYN